ncbi:hypothetical protein WJX81_005375 [Elliptochloris bilobata]|uniref:Plastid lipid-associated protein/fibrillin conserved domain-containing protein n=1 Tax=Elliptochloris bilobata TaxID=381761 RepID=A0AAW1RTG4_9CHLO
MRVSTRSVRPTFGHRRVARPSCHASSPDAQQGAPARTRRNVLHFFGALGLSGLLPLPAHATEADARQRLLDAIKAKKGDEEVITVLRELAKSNSTAGAARSPALAGRWNLLWASSNAEVSRVKRLPIPAESTQLLGKDFVGEEGRGANLIDIFNGAVEVKLSSAAVPDDKANDTIVIGPPFYLELHLGGVNIPIQDTQPGGGRKSILGNELNYFRQLYLEDSGKPGDLRVSEVYEGDPAVKGSIFVHERT